jgi:predicted nucleotidyltransferase
VDSLGPLAAALSSESGVRLAVVFGSATKGGLHRRSDLDIAVMGVAEPRLPSLAVALGRIAGREVDLIALETATPLLRFEIARDGEVLVERRPHLWSDFKAKAMVDWWDWAPLARRFGSAATARLKAQAEHGPA